MGLVFVSIQPICAFLVGTFIPFIFTVIIDMHVFIAILLIGLDLIL